MTDAEEGMRPRYGDILDGREDPATLRVVRRLEGHFRADAPWPSVPRWFDPTLGRAEGELTERRDHPPRGASGILVRPARNRWRRVARSPRRAALRRVHLRMGVAAVAVLALSSGLVLAATTILNLGKPTNNVSSNPRFPLSGFHYDSHLQTSGKPHIIFLGTLSQYDRQSALERWPVVKALTQFGTFSGVRVADHYCRPDPAAQRNLCTIPTYDWSHASYHSAYITFEHKDLVKRGPKTGGNISYQRMNRSELALYKNVTHLDLQSHFPTDPYNTLIAIARDAMPIVVIGKYIETISQVLIYGDFMEQVPGGGIRSQPTPGSNSAQTYATGYSFQQIQTALVNGKDPPFTSLNADVNGEANIVSALICHADGGKPARVCDRPTIKYIEHSIHR